MKLRSKIIIQLFVTNICAFNMVQPLIKEYVTKIVENVVTFFVVNMVWPLIFALTTWLRLFFFTYMSVVSASSPKNGFEGVPKFGPLVVADLPVERGIPRLCLPDDEGQKNNGTVIIN
jgi:hypothetical protein